MYPKVQRSTVYSSQDMEATYMSNNGWMDREDAVCIYIQIYIHIYGHLLHMDAIRLHHENEWNDDICSNMMNLDIIILSEVSQIEKNKYRMLSLIYRTF